MSEKPGTNMEPRKPGLRRISPLRFGGFRGYHLLDCFQVWH